MIQIINSDVMEGLKQLPDKSIHCVVTSPPYWGLRDYGVEGQIGLEPTPEEYVAKLVEVFQGVKRVLRDDGTLWVNLGDSYSGSWGDSGHRPDRDGVEGTQRDKSTEWFQRNGHPQMSKPPTANIKGLKPKDLVGIPWRVAFALQADGWYLRSDIIWSKPNPMPESVTDRPTKAHEYVFLLTESARYFYDADAIREKGIEPTRLKEGLVGESAVDRKIRGYDNCCGANGTRNKRTVWEICTQPTPEAHFATFPGALVEPCIKAGTSERGCCGKCGAPLVRVVEKEQTGELLVNGEFKTSKSGRKRANAPGSEITSETSAFKTGMWKKNNTVGWQPSCACNADTTPCKVLDPFGGSGTVAKVARDLKRDAVMIEINPEYVKIMRKRLRLNEQLVVE